MLLYGIVSREKSHGSTRSTYIDRRVVAIERVDEYPGIVTFGQVMNGVCRVSQRTDDECAVADTLGCGQLNVAGVRVLCCNAILQRESFYYFLMMLSVVVATATQQFHRIGHNLGALMSSTGLVVPLACAQLTFDV